MGDNVNVINSIVMVSLIFLLSSSAGWAISGVIVGGLLTGGINYLLQRSQFKHNKEMYYLENMSKERVKEHLVELLNHKKYPERNFITLRKRIGAYSDDELRILLAEVGALKVEAKSGEERWYLKERNDERVNPAREGYS